MVEEKGKKASIKYFLNERMKPLVHNEEEYFPIYGRMIFNKKSTQFPILDMEGRNLYYTKRMYDFEFVQLARPTYMNRISAILLNKEAILFALLKQEYKRLGDKLEFKSFLTKFRLYEKYMHVEFDAYLRKKTLELVVNETNPNEYSELSKQQSFPFLYYKIKELKKEGLFTDEFKFEIPILIALVRHMRLLWDWGEHNKEYRLRASLFSWLFGNDKFNFDKFIVNLYGRNSKYNSPINHPTDILLGDFRPDPDSLDSYMQLIDNQVVKPLIKNK